MASSRSCTWVFRRTTRSDSSRTSTPCWRERISLQRRRSAFVGVGHPSPGAWQETTEPQHPGTGALRRGKCQRGPVLAAGTNLLCLSLFPLLASDHETRRHSRGWLTTFYGLHARSNSCGGARRVVGAPVSSSSSNQSQLVRGRGRLDGTELGVGAWRSASWGGERRFPVPLPLPATL